MSHRKIEISNYLIKIIGIIKKNNKDKENTFFINDQLGPLLEAFSSKLDLRDKPFFIEIPSGKYKLVAIDKVIKSCKNNTDLFQLQMSFVKRDQDKIRKIDISTYQRKSIKFKANEYLYESFYSTIIPSTDHVILDSRCHYNAMKYVFQKMLSSVVKPSQYGLSRDEIDDKVRVSIHGSIRKDYKEVIKNAQASLKEISFVLAQPKKNGSLSKKLERLMQKESKETFGFVAKMAEKIFNLDSKEKFFQNLPFKKIKISFSIDDDKDSMGLLKKEGVEKLIENKFLRESEIKYQADDDSEHIYKAFLSGISISYDSDLSESDFDDADKVLTEQWVKYQLYLRESYE